MANLNPKLLHNLDQYYEQIALLYSEGVGLEEIRERLQISDLDFWAMEAVIFAEDYTYTADNIFGENVAYKFNSNSLQSQEIPHEEL